MIDYFFIFLAIILIPGIEESTPSTADKIFQIHISPNVIENYIYVPEEGLFFTIDSKADATFFVSIPKAFPVLTTDDVPPHNPMISIGDELELRSITTEDECFIHYAISTQNSAMIKMFYAYHAINSPHIVSSPATGDCHQSVFVEPPFNSPFVQLRDGVFITSIACNEGRDLYIKDGIKPLCLKPTSYEKLVQWGYF